MTIREAIQAVQSMYSKGVQSKDTRLSSRQIYFELLNGRSSVIRNLSNKNQFIGEWNYQTLPCVELIKLTIHELNCVVDENCVILRSKNPIPRIIPDMEANIIKYISSIDGTNLRFEVQDFQNVRYNRGNKYTSKKSKVYLRNGYLYLTNKTILTGITMEALFEDAIEVYNFPNICGDCTECKCKDVTEIDFPVDRVILDNVLSIANQSLLSIFLQMSEDKSDNASDDIASRMVHQSQQQPSNDQP